MIVVYCKSGYSCHQQDKEELGSCFCNQEGQTAEQLSQSQFCFFVDLVEVGTDRSKFIVFCCCPESYYPHSYLL